MTEEEAKTKWCPMVRARESGAAEPATNIYYDGERRKCIASDCMMWIETRKIKLNENLETQELEVTDGHCGLTK